MDILKEREYLTIRMVIPMKVNSSMGHVLAKVNIVTKTVDIIMVNIEI